MELDASAPGFAFAVGDLSRWFRSPCRYVPFRVFRRFGFALWDQMRMRAVGLLSRREVSLRLTQAPRSEPDLYVRWESILGKGDLEEVERRRKDFWPSRNIANVEDQYFFDDEMNTGILD